jgi:hypothetical protein
MTLENYRFDTEKSGENINQPENKDQFASEPDIEKNNLKILEQSALKMEGIGLAASYETSKVPEGAFNDVNGVIMFKSNGEVYAIPSNEKSRDLVFKSGLAIREFPVPNLNNAEVWGDESRRNQMESFKEWVRLSSSN